jgi:four helix bundle protein
MHNFKKLVVWRRSMILTRQCYDLTRGFPNLERYGLSSQIQRSAVSIPSNIAEGAGRASNKEFVRFLRIAHGSACELETQLLVAGDLGYSPHTQVNPITKETAEVRRMIFALSESVLSDTS